MDSVADPGGIDENFIFANSLYRPDVSDGGTRNVGGYNEWGHFYEKYVVLKSHIKVTYTSMANGPNNGDWPPHVCALQVTDAQDGFLNISEAVENRACKTKILQAAANGNVVTLTARYNAKKWHGIKDVLDVEELDNHFIMSQLEANDPDLKKTPDDKTFFRIFYQSAANGVNPYKINAECVVTYTVMCKDPRNIPQSVAWIPSEALFGVQDLKQLVYKKPKTVKPVPESDNDDDTDSDALSDQSE